MSVARVTYSDLQAAPQNSRWHTLLTFINKNAEQHKNRLDANFMKRLRKADHIFGCYWELLFCCLLVDYCEAEVRRPTYTEGQKNYDFDVCKNGHVFAVENAAINIPYEKMIDRTAIGNSIEDAKLFQLQITSAIGSKKKQHDGISKDINIPYVLAIGLYGSSAVTILSFLRWEEHYLGTVSPFGAEQLTKKNGTSINKILFEREEHAWISAILISGEADQKML